LSLRIAIIGSGISGSLVARLLATQHEVTLWEADSSPGGHAHTEKVSLLGHDYPVDTAFMVFNRPTYPNFCRLLELLGVASQPSDMSFSVRSHRLEYQGSSLNGLFAQRTNGLRPAFLKMLYDVVKFNRLGNAAVASGSLRDGRSVGDFFEECRLGQPFLQHYLLPMAAAIWSTRPQAILDFPANFLLGFFANHGLMQIRQRPQWRTITGGSQRYVTALLAPLADRVRLNAPVTAVARSEDGVRITGKEGPPEHFDQVVFACHADQALQMLSDPTPSEQAVLRAFPYQANEAVLHTDTRLLPQRRRAWASWNYHTLPSGQASVTYDLSRLQQHPTPTPLLLTLNATASIDPAQILRTFNYHHPAFSRESIAAQQRFCEISNHHRTHYCGAYWGYGFHEDGVNSALAVANDFGIGLEACTAVSTKGPSSTNDESR
jgi:predicted NAD/FAD-binding protein